MREVLASESGRARYRLRKAVVEPVFGQIKEARGIRRFRLRGLERASGEWKLICATHNLLKLFRYRKEKDPDKARKRSRRASSGYLALRVRFFLVQGHCKRDSFAAIILSLGASHGAASSTKENDQFHSDRLLNCAIF